MYRATTPTHTFALPFDTSQCSIIQVTYRQCNKGFTKLYKDNILPDGMTLDEDTIILKLTQEETLLFKADEPVNVQVRVMKGSSVYASQIVSVYVNSSLNEDIL